MLHAGPVPPNPSELLLSERLDTLIKELRERYDYIILDTPPSSLLADAAELARLASVSRQTAYKYLRLIEQNKPKQ